MGMRIAEAVKARELADEANNAKSMFLANISHELRTPMHAVLSYAELGSKKVQTADREKLQSYFERINSSGEHLLALIDNLLDLSKLDAGKLLIDKSSQDVLMKIKDVLREFELLIKSKQLEVKLAAPECDTVTEVDPMRIAQVVRNLLANAIKFTPDGGHISLSLFNSEMPSGRRADDAGRKPALVLEVSDSGIGIPDGELESIFEKFVQSSLTRNDAGGTGLGLSICREIVGAHRGTLVARHNPEGGSTFMLTLPLIKPADTNQQPAAS
jgi:signal transduction histidine kinase